VKKFVIGMVAILALLVVAVLVGPSFVDWNTYKDRIAREVERQTGLRLDIGGDMSLALVPAPTLSAQSIGLAAPDDDFSAPLARIASLDVRVALFPLLRGDIQVENVALIEPVILLETLADGRRSWAVMEAAGAPRDGADATAPPGGSGAAGIDVRLDSIRVEDGRIVYRDLRSGQEEQLEDLDAEFAAESLRGPFAADGAVTLRGLRTTFETAVGRLLDEGATSLSVILALAERDARARFSGALVRRGNEIVLNGRSELAAGDLAGLVRSLGGARALPGVLATPFSFEGDLNFENQRLQLTALAIELADADVTGSAAVALERAVEVTLQLAANHVDLDDLLAGTDAAKTRTPAEAGDGEGSGGEAAGAPATAVGVDLPDDITAELDVAIENLVYRGQPVRELALVARLSNGELELTRASAQLPGAAAATLSGRLSESGGTPVFSGGLSARADNLRGLLDWLQVDVARVPADRLRRMTLETRIAATPQQVAALAQAQSTGRLSLSLVGALDQTTSQVIEVDQSRLLGLEAAEAPEPPQMEEERCTVRTRRGAEVVVTPIPCTN